MQQDEKWQVVEKKEQKTAPEDEEDGGLYANLFAPIASRISALGGVEDSLNNETGDIERVYRLGDECLGCLRDLKKFWRKFEDDEERTVARIFYDTALMANDLVPILQTSVASGEKGRKVALASADLIMAMTWPINVAEELQDADLRGEMEETARRDFSTMLAIQLAYKAVLLRAKAIPTLFSLLLPILEIPKLQRRTKDDNIILLVLHIFRNLFAIKDKASSMYQSSESVEQANLQSELICQMHACSAFDFLVTLAALSNDRDYRRYNLIILDILHLVFCNIKPETLVKDVQEARQDQLKNLLGAEEQRRRVDKRKGATRHNRFGTTMSLTTGDKRYIMHKQAAVFVSPSKILDQAKKGKRKKNRLDDSLSRHTEIRSDALVCLQQVAQSFLESAFNSFVDALLLEFRSQLQGAKELDYVRYLVLAGLFLDYFGCVQRDEKKRGIAHDSDDGHDFDLVAEIMTDRAVAFPMARMMWAFDEKPPNWTELHAGVKCLTQCLLTMEALSASLDPDYREVGDILQHKFYYEPEPLEKIVAIISKYRDQSRRYLDSIVHLSYVLLRMLERYSKNNEFMHIKKKRKNVARRQSKRQRKPGDDQDHLQGNSSDDEEAVYERSQVEAATHLFQFTAFEAQFASEGVLATCLFYLSNCHDFEGEEQFKHIVSLMHRQAVKAKADPLFFKASALSLFKQIYDDRKTLPKHQASQDLIKLVDYILKRFFKLAREHPMLLLEVFYPTKQSDISKLRKGENIYDPAEPEMHVKMPAAIGGNSLSDLDEDPDVALSGQQAKKGGKRKRKRIQDEGESSESEPELETAAARRKKRKAEAVAAYKSAQFIDSEDDRSDEERDRLFFAKESELRRKRETEGPLPTRTRV